MTLEKDQPKPQTTRQQKIIWTVTLTVAGAGIIVAIVLAIVNHAKLF
jgi:hypothetical protein